MRKVDSGSGILSLTFKGSFLGLLALCQISQESAWDCRKLVAKVKSITCWCCFCCCSGGKNSIKQFHDLIARCISERWSLITTQFFLNHSPLAWLSGAMTVLPDIHHGQTPPLAFRDSRSVGAGICYGWPCPFPTEKPGSPAASAKFGVLGNTTLHNFPSVPGHLFLFP